MSKRSQQEPDSAIDQEILAWIVEQEQAVRTHPDSDALVAYHEGDIKDDRGQQIRHHLTICSSCRNELLILDAFDEEPSSELYPSAQLAEESWQRFRSRTEAREASASQNVGWKRLSPKPWLLAASCAIGLALGLLVATFFYGGSETPGGITTGAAPFVFDLDPLGSTLLRTPAGVPEIELPDDMDVLVPRLSLGDVSAHKSYSVEVYDRSTGRLVLRRQGLVRHRTGMIAFLARRDELPEGEYEVRLMGVDGERREELASYVLRIHDAY